MCWRRPCGNEERCSVCWSLFLPPGKQLCEEERRAMQAALDSIVCHTPLNNLGFSRKGSALTFSVAFQALRTGLFEVGWGGSELSAE